MEQVLDVINGESEQLLFHQSEVLNCGSIGAYQVIEEGLASDLIALHWLLQHLEFRMVQVPLQDLVQDLSRDILVQKVGDGHVPLFVRYIDWELPFDQFVDDCQTLLVVWTGSQCCASLVEKGLAEIVLLISL